MADSFYVRVRGKPQGPYTPEQLQVFAKRGQFSRLHEVSPDGVSWVRASSFPDLFTNDVTIIDAGQSHAQPIIMAAPEPTAHTIGPAAPATPQRPQSNGERCFYTVSGVEHGPIDFLSLRALVSAGKIGENDLVWIEGSADWTPPYRVPGLMPAGSLTLNAHSSGDASGVSVESMRAIAGTRPWVLFIAILTYLGAAFAAVLGVYQLIAGAKSNNMFLLAEGIFCLVFSALNGFHGYLLTNYWNCLGQAIASRQIPQMDAAMNSQRRYWMFVGIQAIVFVTFLLVIMVWGFAAGAALAGRR